MVSNRLQAIEKNIMSYKLSATILNLSVSLFMNRSAVSNKYSSEKNIRIFYFSCLSLKRNRMISLRKNEERMHTLRDELLKNKKI